MPRAPILPSLVRRAHPENNGLGRRVPTDFDHLSKYTIRAALAPVGIERVEKVLRLPWWHWTHDQGSEGACVGFGTSMMMAILNTQQNRDAKLPPYTVRYDPWWLWDRAKEIDEWDDTNPGDPNGTSVRAACEIARTLGLVRYKYTSKLLERLGFQGSPDVVNGISTYRWANTVDEMRACIAAGSPISIGVNWYANFDRPERLSNGEDWIGRGDLGAIRGGHCVCVYGASDRRQAFRVKNSWGRGYPLVWLPYATMERLLGEYGEACIVTDR